MLSLGCGTLFWLAMGIGILKGMAYGDECFEVDENDPVKDIPSLFFNDGNIGCYLFADQY